MEKYSRQVSNQAWVEQITSGDPRLEKVAQTAVTEFTRTKMREEGFWGRILPQLKVENSELDRQHDTDKNVIVIDMEPDSPAAISIPYGTLPNNRYLRGRRYRVMFDRIVSPRFIKDVSELRNYHMDVRQVVSDNAVKDMLAEEDGKPIQVINMALGAPNSIVPETGVAQNVNFGPINRVNWNESLKIMPRSIGNLRVKTILINHVTAIDLQKWGRAEMGGDLSEKIAREGLVETTLFGVDLLITIKRDLVPDGVAYHFAEPKYLGKNFVLEDTTLAVERKFYIVEFFAYKECGSTIANIAAIARANFIGLIEGSY